MADKRKVKKLNREKQLRYKKRQEEKGNVFITIRISKEAKEIILKNRNENETQNQVFDRIILEYEKLKEVPAKISLEKMTKEDKIQKVKELVKQGLSNTDIANYLNENNIKPLSNKGKWHRKTIHYILKKY